MFSKSNALGLFPTLVWMRELQESLATRLNGEFKQHFQGFIDTTPAQKTLQTSQDLHKHAEFAELVKVINSTADDILNFLEVDHPGFQISGWWANFGAPGSDHGTHNHVNNYLSGVYYVNAPSGGNAITFYDPRAPLEQIAPRFKNANAHNSSFHNVAVKPGTLLIFPAWLAHSVPPNGSAEVRISISFNIIFSHFSEERNLSTTLRHSPLQFTVQDLLSLDWVG